MKFKNAYLSFFCIILVGIVVILHSKPCVAEPPKIDCTVEPCAVKQGKVITVKVESDEQLKALKVFLKQPRISSAPMIVQDMIGRKCIEIDMKREKGNKHVGCIDTSDLIPGGAVIKTYATNLDKEHATHIIPIKIR
jgi:hypothetical protein